MDISFKTLEVDLIPTVLEMMEELYVIDAYNFNKSNTEINLSEFIKRPELGNVWLAELKGKFCAYAILTYGYSFERNGRFALLDELFIKADFRNIGIGKQILAFLENQCKLNNVNAILLECEPENISALHVYKNFGFKDTERMFLSKIYI